MTVWEILGIEPTSDRRAIRKAYAERLRATRVEAEPERFQALREAYETALWFSEMPDAEAEAEVEVETAVEPRAALALPPVEEAPPRDEDRIPELMARVEALYDGPDRLSVDAWRAILTDEGLGSLDARRVFQSSLLFFLLDHRELTNPIWRLFEEEFHWSQQWRTLYGMAPSDAVDRILNSIDEAVANRPGAETVALEPVEVARASRSDARFPWWGMLGFFIALRFCATLDERPSPPVDPSSSRRIVIHWQQLIEAREDPTLYKTMDIGTLHVAAVRNETEAQWELGRRYLEGDRVEANRATAESWLGRAAAAGHEEARRKLDELSAESAEGPTSTESPTDPP